MIILTVLMSVHNAEDYLAEAIESILNQTFRDFEFLIINDGSTDRSREIILSYSDPRIQLIDNEYNIGLASSLNKGIQLSTGKYIVRMDADDISLPKRLQFQVDFMESHPDIAVCGSWFEVFGYDFFIKRHPVSHQEICVEMLNDCAIGHPTVIIRREVLENKGLLYDETLKSGQDYDLWVRALHLLKFHNLPLVLLRYRTHSSQTSSKKWELQQKNAQQIRYRLYIELLDNETQIALFNDFIHRTRVDLPFKKQLPDLLRLVIESNRTKNLYSQPVFIEFLRKKWFSQFYYQQEFSLSSLKIFLKCVKLLKINIFSFDFFKYLLKSIINYKKNVGKSTHNSSNTLL